MELIAVVLDGLSAGDGFFPMRGRFIEDFFGFRCPPLLEQRLSEPGQHQAKDISPRCMLRLVMHESFLDCAGFDEVFLGAFQPEGVCLYAAKVTMFGDDRFRDRRVFRILGKTLFQNIK